MPKEIFPPIADKIRLKKLRSYKRLFEGEHYKEFGIKDYFVDTKDKEKKLYIAKNTPALISEYFADLVIGRGILFDVDNAEVQKKIDEISKNNKMDILVFELALSQSTYGYASARVRIRREKVILEQIPVDQYFPYFTGTINPERDAVCLASYILLKDDRDQEAKYLYKQIYFLEGQDVMLEHQLWLINSNGELAERKPISLFDASLPSVPEPANLNEIPIYQFDNIKTSGDLFGKSDYKDIETLVEEINNRVTQISLQLIKHLNAKLAVPIGTLNAKGQLKAHEADIFEVGEGKTPPSYITNPNPQIENGFKQIEKLTRDISAITKIPKDVFGLDSEKGGVEKVEAMKIRLFNTIRKVERKRVYLESDLSSMMKMALILSGVAEDTIGDIRIVWDDALPEDIVAKTQTLADQVNSGLKSKRKAIKELQELDEEDLNIEIEAINKDNQATTPAFSTPPRIESPKDLQINNA